MNRKDIDVKSPVKGLTSSPYYLSYGPGPFLVYKLSITFLYTKN